MTSDRDQALARAVGERLRQARTRTGLSLTRLALETSVPKSALSVAEQGRGFLSVPSLIRVAEALGCSTDTLLRVTKKSPPQPVGADQHFERPLSMGNTTDRVKEVHGHLPGKR